MKSRLCWKTSSKILFLIISIPSSMFRMPMAVVYRFLPLCFPFVALVISLGLVAPLFHSNCSCAVSFPLLPAISRVYSAVFLFPLPLFAMLCFYSCICIFMTL
ncbi:hypothetical protein BDV30DRAFT_52809 [Aspergillus minisclerotigenes]|uniref:Uncharacterized protein n=1 Tax=Aspergillus minisclerotigenes TaxID=656917 RepID=A0A5N6IJV8_9EURO|nr:hypothetical protein BDV30DRAFT_52809 [Aspergillus minisclerotigenes]